MMEEMSKYDGVIEEIEVVSVNNSREICQRKRR